MAPFLAIGGYGLADLYMTSKEDAKYYQLVPKGDCKPLQGACEIEGIGLTLQVSFDGTPQSNQLLPITVTSKDRLDDVALSILSNGQESAPVGASHNDLRTVWNTAPQLKTIGGNQDLKLRLVISEKGKMHFAEVPVTLN
ncbi:hypothetical protein EOL70_12000 [Leucothrix sargassi]|nr:hypothetical protein EOL70_12000 [Leucothrix sargassi]